MLDRLPDAAFDAILAEVGPGTSSSLLSAELRHLGGALGRHPGAGAVPRLRGAYSGFFVAIAATPEMAAAGRADARRLIEVLGPWSSGRTILNFTEERGEARTAFVKSAWARLQAAARRSTPTACVSLTTDPGDALSTVTGIGAQRGATGVRGASLLLWYDHR